MSIDINEMLTLIKLVINKCIYMISEPCYCCCHSTAADLNDHIVVTTYVALVK